MGRRLLAVVAVAVVAAGTATASFADRWWQQTGPVTALDETQQSIAAGVAWTPRSCEHVVLWVTYSFARYTFRNAGPCPAVSTGRGIAAVSTSGRRVAWLSYVGGNTREWRLWTATPSARRPRLIASAAADAGSASPIVLGQSNGYIPYAVGRRLVVLADSGARAFTWTATSPIVALRHGEGALGVLLGSGHLLLLSDRDWHPFADLTYAPGEVTTFTPIATGVVVQTSAGISLVRGKRTFHFPLPAAARLVGFDSGQLFYALGNEIRTYDRSSTKDVVDKVVTHQPFLADFDRRGLAWTDGSRLCWADRDFATGPPVERCRPS